MVEPIPIVNMASPNQSRWTLGESAVSHIVCHTPEGSFAGATATIMNSTAQVSYHLLITEDGSKATQFVPWNRKAWHALSWNSIAEGVSLCCYTGKTTREGEEALAKVVAWRLHERGLPPRWNHRLDGKGFCRHADLQSNRSDPMGRWKWRFRFVPAVKRWYDYYAADDLTRKRGYWAWRGWRCSKGPWRLRGRREKGRLYRPDVPRVIPPNWWLRLRRSGGCK